MDIEGKGSKRHDEGEEDIGATEIEARIDPDSRWDTQEIGDDELVGGVRGGAVGGPQGAVGATAAREVVKENTLPEDAPIEPNSPEDIAKDQPLRPSE